MPILVSAIDRFVGEEGEWVRHQTGMRCWCSGRDGQVNPNCPDHDATGSVYGGAREIIGLFTDIMQRKELAATGLFLPGDAIFSPLTADHVSEGDKITLLKPMPYGKGDALVRGDSAFDVLFYAADRSILCIDQLKNAYYEGVDFRFDGKKIVWQWSGKTGSEPQAGVRYTVKYMAFIEWIAFFPPMERFTHGDDLGVKVMLRKLHLMLT